MFRLPRHLFRVLAFAEAVSWTLLIAGLIIRAFTDWPLGVTIGGGIHGFVFLSYGATAILLAKNQRWGAGTTVLVLLSTIIPYATIPVEIWADRTGRLQGAWRRTASDDPRDRTWHDRLFRTVIGHPYLFGALLVCAVTVLFVVLLIIGPPGR